MAKLTPFEVGQIKAHPYHELSSSEVADLVIKSDGEPVSRETVREVMAKLEADPT